MSSGFCVPQLLELDYFLFWLKKNEKGISDFFVTQCISDPCYVLFYECDLRYVILCPSSRQILATPLPTPAVAACVFWATAVSLSVETCRVSHSTATSSDRATDRRPQTVHVGLYVNGICNRRWPRLSVAYLRRRSSVAQQSRYSDYT